MKRFNIKKKLLPILAIIILLLFVFTLNHSRAITEEMMGEVLDNIGTSSEVCSSEMFYELGEDEFKRRLYECSILSAQVLTVMASNICAHGERSEVIISYQNLVSLALDEFIYTGEFPNLSELESSTNAIDNYHRLCSLFRDSVPTVPVREYTSTQRTRTIHFKFANGTRAHDSIVQTARFGTVRDLFSNQERITDDEVVLSALPIPEVEYPTGEYTVLAPREVEIPEMLLTMDSENEEITIVFPLLEYGEDDPIDDDPVIPEPTEPENDRPSIPDTLARIPLFVYITAGVFIIVGIVVFIKARKKEEELEII